jgi:hypothetical protein
MYMILENLITHTISLFLREENCYYIVYKVISFDCALNQKIGLRPHFRFLYNPVNIIFLLTLRFSEKSLLSGHLTTISEAILRSKLCQGLRFQILISEGLPGVKFEEFNYLKIESEKDTLS